MPSKRFDENTKVKAVRLVREHADDYDSEWAAMCAISSRLGMTAETLRKWVRQAEVDAGERDDRLTTAMVEENRPRARSETTWCRPRMWCRWSAATS